MKRLVERAANWFAPLVCPGCEEGSGLMRDCATGRFERCSICQGGPATEERRPPVNLGLQRQVGTQVGRNRHLP